MKINFLKKKFCEIITKDIFAQYKNVKYATKIKFNSDLSIQDFCSQILKNPEFDTLKSENKVEYVLKDKYLLKEDPVVPLSFITKENQPLMILEDSYSDVVLEERDIKILDESCMFQMSLNGLTDLFLNDPLDSKDMINEKSSRLDEACFEKMGKSYNDVLSEIENNKNSNDYDLINKVSLLELKLKEIERIVENNLINNRKFDPFLPEQNIFNLPIADLEKLTRNGHFIKEETKLQAIFDLIFTNFALSVEKEYPLFIEINPIVKPIGYASKPLPFCLLNKITGKIFPFTFALDNEEREENLENYLYKKSIDSLHTLKKVSRCRNNTINRFNVGIVTNLIDWKFTLFLRPEKFLDVESIENLHISRTYRIGYKKDINKLDWAKVTEILNLIKNLMRITNEDLAEEKVNSDVRWKDAANFKRKVMI